jgi:hypothetical protein
MNERIKELAEQCTSYNNSDGWLFDKEKFAELIITECTDIVNKRKDAAIDASWNVDEAMTNAVWDIEEHFYGFYGVEE